MSKTYYNDTITPEWAISRGYGFNLEGEALTKLKLKNVFEGGEYVKVLWYADTIQVYLHEEDEEIGILLMATNSKNKLQRLFHALELGDIE